MNDPSIKPTSSQTAANISTEHPQGADEDVAPPTTQPSPNLSTEHQKPGDARLPTDGLNRARSAVDDGRKSSLTKNA